jgi:hypothetical protein
VTDQAREFVSEAIVWVALIGAFLVLLCIHLFDLRRRRRNRERIRAASDWGPNAAAVDAVLAGAARLDPVQAERLAARRRAAFEWDPRLEKAPKAARAARQRAFENQRNDRATAAADEARDRVLAAVATSGPAAESASGVEAAECAAETAGAIVNVAAVPAAEFRMLTRAWREVVGQVDVRARREP